MSSLILTLRQATPFAVKHPTFSWKFGVHLRKTGPGTWMFGEIHLLYVTIWNMFIRHSVIVYPDFHEYEYSIIYIYIYIYMYIECTYRFDIHVPRFFRSAGAAPGELRSFRGSGEMRWPSIPRITSWWSLGASDPLGDLLIPQFGYGSISIDTIFSGMNIHLPAILGFT